MSFHKRFLSEDSIRSFAKHNDFRSFEIYMTSADAYVIDMKNGNWANEIYNQFGEGTKEKRTEIHSKIVNNEI